MLRYLMVAAALALAVGPLEAQRRPAGRPAARARAATAAPRIGPHLGYNFDVQDALLGAQAVFPLAPAFDLYPSFDFYLVSSGSLWALNFDVRYRPRTRVGALYFGGGLNYLRQSVSGFGGSNTSLNILGGFEARRRRTAPYAELRLTVGEASSFQMVGGVSWRM
jgi:hypothetical protein